MKNFQYLEALSETVLVFDGAMGTNLQKLNLQASDFGGERYSGCNDILNLTRADAVEHVHRSFLEAGVDVIETNTFRSNRITLHEYGLKDKVHQINFEAARMAKRIANAFSTSTQPRFVAGSIGPSGKIFSINEAKTGSISFQEVMDVFKEQATALLEGGVDLLLLETQQDLLEIKAAILGIKQAFQQCDIHVPLQVQVTMDVHNRMLFGSSIDAVLAILELMEINVIGLNCSTGPDEMQPPLEYLAKNTHLPVSCLPNAGMPEMRGDEVIYPLSPQHFAESMTRYVEEKSLSAAGGCCGTTPEHLALLVKNIHGHPAPKKAAQRKGYLSSPLHAREMKQTPPPFIIGERLNTQGSRNFKKIILAEDFTQAETLAAQQIESGAHGLDLCTALTENDLEKPNLVTLIRHISHTQDAPLIIDTTNPNVMEAALQATPGRCLLNSTNFESGNDKARIVFELAHSYAAAVLILTIDESGMAKTLEQKLSIVDRAYRMAVDEVHLPPQSLVFDPLTFSLASGDASTRDSAEQTIAAIRAIKQKYPDCYTSLGVSNISFGFSKQARKILNSVFLYHAIQAGLDMAILNASALIPYPDIPEEEKQAAEQLIFHNSEKALAEFITVFSDKPENTAEEISNSSKKLEPGERIYWHITHRTQDGLEDDISAFIQQRSKDSSQHEAALTLLNEFLLPAMKEVGEQFSKGEIILPFVLQSSEIMRTATQEIEKYIQKQSQTMRGSILLATVYGDVHDIGKNLVKTILENNGFVINDLGKQVPADLIVETALDEGVTAIGLSALLVNTSQQMPIIIEKLRALNSNIPVLIGGAAVNEPFAKKIEKDSTGAAYGGGVYYCKDAFEALTVLDGLNTKGKSRS